MERKADLERCVWWYIVSQETVKIFSALFSMQASLLRIHNILVFYHNMIFNQRYNMGFLRWAFYFFVMAFAQEGIFTHSNLFSTSH